MHRQHPAELHVDTIREKDGSIPQLLRHLWQVFRTPFTQVSKIHHELQIMQLIKTDN